MSEKKIFRVGIYLRLSDEDRDKFSKNDDSESIKNQRNLLLEEISKRDDFLLVDEYCDEDLSGAGTYRPQFERLIKDCESGKLDIVLCKSQSRFSRDMEIIEKYIHNKFILWNVRFIGIADNADTDNMGNKKARQINGLVNEWYLEDVSNNIRSAFKAKMKQGEYISPFASYGYQVSLEDNNKLVIDFEAAEIVKKIFSLYISGLGFMGIAKYLNERKISSPSLYKYQKGIKLNVVSKRDREEIKWSSSAIKSILTNEIYLGHLIQGKRTTVSYKNHKIKKKKKSEWIRFENTHEAIIDKDIFDKVQLMMKERTRVIKKSGMVHLFSGKVFCLECKKRMRKKNSSKFEYLVCSSLGNGYDECVNRKSIRYDILKKIVLEQVNKMIEKFYDVDLLKKEEYENKKKNIDGKIAMLEKSKLEIKDKVMKNRGYLKNIYEDKMNKVITLEQFKFLMNDYSGEIDECEKQMEYIARKIDSYNKDKVEKKGFDSYRKFEGLNRFMVEELIDKIYVGNVDEEGVRIIQIKWNF